MNFEIRRDRLDVTRDGTLPPFVADAHRRSVPGPPRFFVDGQEVAVEIYKRRVLEQAIDAMNGGFITEQGFHQIYMGLKRI